MEAGLKPSEIDELSWRDFSLFVRGYEKRERGEWERSRLISYTTYLMQTGDKPRKTIYKFMPFPWDQKVKQDRGRPLEGEDLQKALKMYS